MVPDDRVVVDDRVDDGGEIRTGRQLDQAVPQIVQEELTPADPA